MRLQVEPSEPENLSWHAHTIDQVIFPRHEHVEQAAALSNRNVILRIALKTLTFNKSASNPSRILDSIFCSAVDCVGAP